MNTPEEVACSAINRFLNFTFSKVWKACTDIKNYSRNITRLRQEVGELKGVEGTVEQKVAVAGWARKTIAPTTAWWKGEFSNIEKAGADALRRAEKLNSGCCKGRLNLRQRLLLSREAVNLTEDVKAHIGKVPTDEDIALDSLPSGMLPSASNEDSEVLKSQMAIIEEVMRNLENDDIYVIGICGMAGVGKNWLVNKIRNRALEGLYSQAPMVVVSERKLYDIQEELAEELGLPLKRTATDGRARELHSRLTTSEHNILITLDKVSEPFKLGDIGIPTGKRLKVIFTSEMVKDSYSPITADKYVPVNVLPPDEAWILFKRYAGDCVETKELRSIAEDVFKECDRLPIAIITLGNGLRNRKLHDWTNARRELQNSAVKSLHGIREKVYKPIRTSCKLLGTRQPQALHLLMLCCLFPKEANIPVEKLIRYANGLPELSEDAENLEATTDKVMSLVDELKNCSLLLSGDKEMIVKMHNVVRNVCLLIASENRHEFNKKYDYLVKHHTELKEWPHEVEQKPYNAISLVLASDDQTQLQLPEGLDYPNLELLQLRFRCNSLNIPAEFFRRMNKVRVIDFKKVSRWGGSLKIGKALPPKADYLLHLQTLSLEFCEVCGEDLLLIAGLKKLEILSLFSSKLDELPSTMRELSNLKLLDLRCADDGPKIIPSGTLSALKKLEDLYMGNYDSWSKDSEQSEETSRTSIKELSSLAILKTLQVRVKFPELLRQLKDLSFEKLERYQITGVRTVLRFREYEIGKSLRFDEADWRMLLDPKMRGLLTRCEDLTLTKTSFEDLFQVCANLKTLELSYCEGVESMIDERDSATALNKLKHMKVTHMNNLKELCKGNLPAESLVELETMELMELPEITHLWGAPIIQPPCLGNLKVIEIGYCDAITSFFPISVAICLVQLQKLDIQKCFMLEGILSNEGGAAEKIVFPKLSFLSLDKLPSFRSFLPVKVMEGSIRSTLKLDKLTPESATIHTTVKLDKLTPESATIHTSESDSAKPGVLAECEDNDDGAIQCLFNPLVELPSMNKLMVRSMNNLKHLVNGTTNSESVSKLRVVRVDRCEKLLNLASSDCISLLQSLEKVEVQKCQSLKEVFDFEGFNFKHIEDQSSDSMLSMLDTVSLYDLKELEHIWRMVPEGVQGFGNLRSLEISRCCSLTYAFSVSVAKMLKSLQSLRVNGCVKVVEIIETDRGSELTDIIKFPQLNDLQLDRLDCLTSFSSGNHEFEFPNLQEVVINGCPRMKAFCWGGLRGPAEELVKRAIATNLRDSQSII